MRQVISLVAASVFFLPCGYAQKLPDKNRMTVESHTVLATDQVPFWLEMNRLGQVDDGSQIQQIILFNWQQSARSKGGKLFFDYGASLAGRLSGESSLYAEQYWGRIQMGKFYFLAGAKAEPIWANGLSHTNGDLFLSNNARPNPRGELGIENFSPFSSGWLNRFSFDARYAEYILLDDRYVDDANLHHKRIMINYRINQEFTFHVGMDHWVFWGGTSPDPEIGKMPGFKYYLRYILGRGGGEESPETDQNNIAGNQLGQNLFQLDFKQPDYEVKVYYQHLFDDGSGFLFHNMQDGFWGLSFHYLKERPLVQRMIIEFVNTTDQSGPYHKYAPDPSMPDSLIGEGRDNYFNHGVYQSGFVSYNRMMGSPLFIPTIVKGISTGFQSTRLRALHGGIDGYLSDQIYWSGRGTYSRHYGLYEASFPRFRDLFSLEGNLMIQMRQKPIIYGIKIATDFGRYLEDSWGCEFSVQYRIK
jgi:hypothetical protein